MHFSLGIGEESSAEGLGLQNFQGRQCIDCAEAEAKNFTVHLQLCVARWKADQRASI